jgi:glycosyltransferase involved in cell wall biosynthesis
MSTPRPLITVVTPTFNAAATLHRCCESVAAQDCGAIEHIIADGGSTDATLDIAGQYSTVIEAGPDAGVYDGMSKGVRRASGSFVHILNADDTYADASVLSQILHEMESRGLDLCHARAAQITATGKIVHVIGRDVDKQRLLQKMRVAHPTVVVRKAVYDRYGTFSVGFRVAGDYEFLLRIWDRVQVGFIDAILVNMSIGGVSTRGENVARSYRESAAAALLHGMPPWRAAARCSYEIVKHRVFFARRYGQRPW